MTSQIFKIQPSIEIFHKFIRENSTFSNNKYVFSKTSFKKAQMKNEISEFVNNIKDKYYSSKQFYTERTMNYKNVITIIRQICRFHHIPFTSSIKYSNSKYEISYDIIIPEPTIDT
jgi:hypothetical protein